MSSDVTIQSFALEMQVSVDRLIKQFLDIGIKKTKVDFVTKIEKEMFLQYIHDNNISSIHKFLLRRQTRSTLNILSIGGKNKQVQVEVRKKQMYVLPYTTTKECNLDSLRDDETGRDKHQSDNNDTSTNFNKNNKLIISSTSNTKHNALCNQTLKKNQCLTNTIDLDCKLNTKTHLKIHDKSQKIINKKQQLNKIKNTYSHGTAKSFINHTNKNNYNHANKFGHASMLDNDDYQLNTDKRYPSRMRSKSKLTGKSFKQKKNSNFSYGIVTNELEQEEKLYVASRFSKNKRKQSTLIHSFSKPTQLISRNIIIGETISVLELSDKMSVKSSYMIKLMMQLGLIVTINQIIDQETAQLIIEEMGHNAILRRENELEELIMNNNQTYVHNSSIKTKDTNDCIIYKNRAPVVTIMGHVDHGKTSLLDYIRSTKIATSELGGITQSIGVYRVLTKNGKSITFLDTPGHAAFAKMRFRGAQLTDIAVLVVAADDGVMPQTIESIQHIKSINIPVIVVINKIDKIDINIDRIKHELNRYELIPEEWGGNTQFVNVSAVSGFGVNDLLDAILLQSEVLELKTAYQGMAKAIVIESSLDKGKGPVVVVLIKEGELKCGDIILCGTEYGRVRAMKDEYGYDIDTALPSMPVELLGLSGVPNAGDMMVVVHNEKKAREVAIYRQNKRRVTKLAHKHNTSSIEDVFNNINNNIKITELNFIIKSDTQGSLEAIYEAIKNLSTNLVIIKILFASIGDITETDVILASTSHAIILGFNVKSNSAARRMIELDSINVRYYSIIYDLLNDVEKIIHNSVSISPSVPNIIGSAEVHNIFNSPTYGTIAGCIVIEGIIKSRKKVMVVRNNLIIHKGELESLRRFKNDVNEVKRGMECGIGIKNYHDIKLGDIIKVLDLVGSSH